MKRTKEARRIARELLRSTFVDGRIDEARARQVVAHIKDAKPRGYLEIVETYFKLLRLELARRHAIVESATALGADMEKRVRDDLTRSYGDLTFEFRVDPELLGGMRIQVGSDVWDGSVRARLAHLADAIA